MVIGDTAMTLEKLLLALADNDRLDDGAETWDKWGLMEMLNQTDDTKEDLQRLANVANGGIYLVGDDGMLESLPAWRFVGGEA